LQRAGRHFEIKERIMLRTTLALIIAALFTAACNTMDGLVTDVDRGVSKLQGEDNPNRR
jgi:predicted small secreted protein